ncbi:hypothetical protein FSP39_024873 [Pinctada imbricata]|uniref:Retinol dehydrogenase 13 n=1 Tax=Pinctada imbricata TaxID=66713 RepID=A0AA89BSQ4_PINIB|nr:hypothetical protein FSP39_024873 [Pinctada imbricata]
MDMDQFVEFLDDNKVIIGSAIGIGFGLILLKKYLAGGVCRSKARLDGKTVIVTGSNTGIGKETVRDLAKRGARIIMACRDMKRTEPAAEELRTDTGNKNIVVRKLDLASLKSVRSFAEEILKTESRIDILINNAGVMYCPYSKTADGFEMQFGTNHLGPFLLTNLLLDRIKDSAPARIVNVSSIGHSLANPLDLENLNSEKGYDPYEAYHRSKLLNILFTRELSRRLKGSGVTANSLHPGFVNTDLPRHFNKFLNFVMQPFMWLSLKDSRAGAQTSIYCAVAEELVGVSGKYFSDCAVKEEVKQARDDQLAKRLWEMSEEMVAKAK